MELGYLRLLRFVGINSPRATGAPIRKSRDILNDWITCKSLGGEVDIGYGLLQHSVHEEGGGVSSFETYIELPVSATQSETSELKRLSLQGEAYFRRRYHGSVAPMLGELRTMRGELGNGGHVKIDMVRPIITVILDVRQLRFWGRSA